MNALLTGVVLQITSGAATASATPALARFSLAKTAGVPNTVIIAIVAVGVVSAVMRTSVLGRQFVAVGTSPAAAHAAGIRVRSYQVGTYVVASLSYGAAGVLIAGFLGTPGIGAGNDYLLPTIAAVVLGGTSLAGGMGSVAATAVRRRVPDAARAGRARHGRAELDPARDPGRDHRARHGAAAAPDRAAPGALAGSRLRGRGPPPPLSLSLEGANDPPPLEQHDNRLADPRRPSTSPPGSRRKR